MTAFIIVTIHMNLCIGTLAPFAQQRPDLKPLLDDLINFNACGEFLLTEVGHGLDARNLETTATLLPDGSFDLHTPVFAASKAMPPSTPRIGVPRMGVVFARLVVNQEDHGIKPFIIWLSDGEAMYPGVTSRVLPTRPGTKPLDHAITRFDHVHLPATALLAPACKPKNSRADFLSQIWRVSVGTLALSIMGISSIRVACEIAIGYSQRRTTGLSGSNARVPIWTFSTQRRPILKARVFSVVLDAFARRAAREFTNPSHPSSIRHAFATICKAAIAERVTILTELSERCGWQGLFAYNQIMQLALTFQGSTIAEGDTLVLCIRTLS